MKHTISHLHSIFLDDDTLLLWAQAHAPSSAEVSPLSVRVEDAPCPSPLLSGSFQVEEAHYLFAVLRHASFREGATCSIELLAGEKNVALLQGGTLTQEGRTERLLYLFSHMPHAEQERFFSRLTGEVEATFDLSCSPRFRSLCTHLLNALPIAHFHVAESYWLAPATLYLEGEVEDGRPYGEPSILLLSEAAFSHAKSRFIQLSERRFAFLILFNHEDAAHLLPHASLAYASGERMVRFVPIAPHAAYGLEFMHYLNAKPPYPRQELRALICQTLIDFHAPQQRHMVKDLIHSLQLYVTLPEGYCNLPNEPFNLHFDTIIPIGTDGVFFCGWMRDPYHALESLEIHSALGFSYTAGEELFRIKRPDVQEAFRNSPYGNFNEDMGVVAYAPLPPEIKARIGDVAELHALSFTAKLRGNIQYTIQPEIHYRDARTARDLALKLVPAHEVTETMLDRCLGPVASLLHQQCMSQVQVRAVYEIGTLAKKPRISLSIPLYQRLEFIKIQFAVMAGDPAMQDVELIFVLDSPWQEAEVRALLEEYSQLYQLPARLVVLHQNSGYAAASNLGTEYARGEYIVLFNSDVVPITPGWASKMADFYARQKNIGALAPKLLYEDDSLQHAGMFFAKATHPDWINLHYYKGYPRHFPSATVSRPVPAVTGACLMMSRSLWEEVGRLSVDYVVGDFEDSDLCLKCAARGLENWYFADAELYHLERQSVPLNASYTESIAWRYNARQHTKRWAKQIESLMNKYGAF